MIPVERACWEADPGGGDWDAGTLVLLRAGTFPDRRAHDQIGLTPEERARAEGMGDAVRRAQYIAGHALLNRFRARQGAPLFTSLSHSDQWVVAAAAHRGPVGVDVERIQPNRPLERLSRRFFPAGERDWLLNVSTEERLILFYALWTAKEALFKALGMPAGAAHFAARQVIAFGETRDPLANPVVEGCRVGWFDAAPGYLGAYAVPEGIARVRCLQPE